MRVVSLVPSWTETLAACGVEVVGRTRFCVHPELPGVPVVGGTKDLDFAKVEALRPDLLLLDREENLPWMAEGERPWKTYCTHVEGVGSVARELEALAGLLGNARLGALAREWGRAVAAPVRARGVGELPGLLEWLRRPAVEPERILYLIWRDPWMGVGKGTFVHSMLEQCGLGGRLAELPGKYPKLELAGFDPASTLLLFSSEPYPFARRRAELAELPFASALVDGEAFSWFGLRSLRFLEKIKSI